VKVLPDEEELPLSVAVSLAVLEVLVATLDLVVVGSADDVVLAELVVFTEEVVGLDEGAEDVVGSATLATGATVDEGSADELVLA
jgi:hypothetical protein